MVNDLGATMPEPSYHLSATIPLKSLRYLEWLGLEAKRGGGMRLPKSTTLRAMLNVAMRLDINVSGVRNQDELEDRIWRAIRIRSQQILRTPQSPIE